MSDVRLSNSNRIATITFTRSDKLNALSLGLSAELLAAVDEISSRDDVDALVLGAEGRAFCAGGDVGEMAASPDMSQYLADLTEIMHEALTRIRALPIPVIARVQGAVAGGGLGLMLSADIAVIADTVRLSAAYGELGLSPDCGASVLLPRAVGERRAREFFLLGQTWNAAQARDYGLVTEVVPAEALDERVAEVVRRAHRPGTAAVAAMKNLLAEPSDDYGRRMDAESQAISTLAGSDLAKERVIQFAQRSGLPNRQGE
ncbi:enoyl-CoA hydratase/isomerase family protein [Microbacterium sp. NIBRBAC000506063]|uniref:enoyl-CoA hydratase/isomerase family protein n=1 Tax=Microbacterium sp. NIBRBAC000506063 TaxID=2734618 RepID=UPI001BB5414E|nr:enoyl-CoA hydratase/isomerase family protein [Microbacterium sp. NIBRBAC000506063]QTV80501.1 enoyl-CoA hydratase/isomerase family protein [Microbacterium sp. NIBRBAC000506063]